MKNSFLKASVSLAVAFLMLASIVGCGTSTAPINSTSPTVTAATEAPKKEVVTLNYPTFAIGANPGAPMMKILFDEFNAKFTGQIELKIDEIPGDVAYTNKMKVLLASDNLPDVIDGKNGLRDLAVKANLAVDLTPYMDADPAWQISIPKIAREKNTIDGKLVSIAETIAQIGYFYNKDLFNNAGIAVPPQSWDELIVDCDKLLAAGITPFALQTADTGWVCTLLIGSFIGTNGEAGNKFMNTMHPESFETPECIDAFKKIQLILTKYSNKDAIGINYEVGANIFRNGKAAMFPNGPWMISDFSDTSKSLPGFDKIVGCASYPGTKGDGTGVYNTVSAGYVVTTKDKAHQDAAVEFVKFITNDHAQQLALDMTSISPMSPNVKVSDEIKAQKPILADLINASANAKYSYSVFDSIDYSSVGPEFTKQLDALGSGKTTPEAMAKALTAAEAKK